jgi:GntR family transcriptional repressor for pyruvate dehydrogenase complex
MTLPIEPLHHRSLKAACISHLEKMILSGQFKIGERLPAERDLASRLDISRPVLHEALIDLAGKGLVRIVPRRGVFVNDYRISGSLALLESLLAFHEGSLAPAFRQSLIDMRLLIETETARLAALHRTSDQIQKLRNLLAAEQNAMNSDVETLTELDFFFHLEIAVTSGNQLYPLFMNSFKGVYTYLTGEFFRKNAGSSVIEEVYDFHWRLLNAIEMRDSVNAAAVMVNMLRHGERYLKGEN